MLNKLFHIQQILSQPLSGQTTPNVNYLLKESHTNWLRVNILARLGECVWVRGATPCTCFHPPAFILLTSQQKSFGLVSLGFIY